MDGTITGFVIGLFLRFVFGLIDRWLAARRLREEGRSEERKRQQDALEKAEEHWDEVDRSELELDVAVDGLRERSGVDHPSG